ncbi:MAG: protein phosphatase 2C domain-containing protein [Anaerolineales bacterium]|nr:protein phosphatase 2C domain-containing protein [Anaerolineales bacterium]MCS7247957.1 protein phosphatase 2C domain-containing protein [Anaerolineales bacterium]MDW8161768.1 protein phosphatase 2C domain-containing protein [Anaerolineales bacterium]MDW8448063.1 protein phosphatase 2C domain-containing protein [Anaerolineales bacterium]
MKSRRTLLIQTAAITHPGMSGKRNEDRFRIHHFVTPDHRQVTLAVVADGIGGHRAGEIAANLTTTEIVRSIEELGLTQPTQALRQAMYSANQVVLSGAQSNPQWAGMGSTCACALIVGERLYTASAGDSRIYLIRGSRIIQLSRDHTWVQEAIELGTLSAAAAQRHPNAHVIRRYIGAPHGVQPDTRLFLRGNESDQQAEANQGLRLKPGDCIIVCSDGLTDLVTDREILAQIRKRPLDLALQELVHLANCRGGYDNITIVAVQIAKSVGSRVRGTVISLLSGLALFGLLGGWLGFYFWERDVVSGRPSPTLTELAPLPAFYRTPPVASPGELGPAAPSPTEPWLVAPSPSATFPLWPTATFTPWPTHTPEP